jgi:hypothetical protein
MYLPFGHGQRGNPLPRGADRHRRGRHDRDRARRRERHRSVDAARPHPDDGAQLVAASTGGPRFRTFLQAALSLLALAMASIVRFSGIERVRIPSQVVTQVPVDKVPVDHLTVQ